MDTQDVLDELLAQYDESPGLPAGLDAEEAELFRKVMHLAPDAASDDEPRSSRAVGSFASPR